MIGPILNTVGIVAGGIIGLARKKPLSLKQQTYFKLGIGLATIVAGLRLTWISLNGSLLQILKQLGIVIVSLILGRLTGRLLRLQKMSNHLGRLAQKKMLDAKPENPRRLSDGFQICSILFCAAPMGIVGAICSGLTANAGDAHPEYFFPLAVKAVVDGLAAMSFVSLFGWGTVLSAVPVLVLQGTIALLSARLLQPFLAVHNLVDPLNATAGLLIFCVALIIFEIKKVEVTDYLPALVFAPLLAGLLR